ncbi:MAG: hypothetical protein ACFFAN_17195 [Promethearchaeota archaeon]
MVGYKLAPVKKLFSQKISAPDGTPNNVLEISTELGMLTREQYDLLLKIKSGKNINTSEKNTQRIIQELLEKQIIQKK